MPQCGNAFYYVLSVSTDIEKKIKLHTGPIIINMAKLAAGNEPAVFLTILSTWSSPAAFSVSLCSDCESLGLSLVSHTTSFIDVLAAHQTVINIEMGMMGVAEGILIAYKNLTLSLTAPCGWNALTAKMQLCPQNAWAH